MFDPDEDFNTDDAYEYAEQDAQRRQEFDNLSDEERDHRDDWNERGRELRNWG